MLKYNEALYKCFHFIYIIHWAVSLGGVNLQQAVKQAFLDVASGINPHLELQAGEQATANATSTSAVGGVN